MVQDSGCTEAEPRISAPHPPLVKVLWPQRSFFHFWPTRKILNSWFVGFSPNDCSNTWEGESLWSDYMIYRRMLSCKPKPSRSLSEGGLRLGWKPLLTKGPYIPGSFSLYHQSHREKTLPRFIEKKDVKWNQPALKQWKNRHILHCHQIEVVDGGVVTPYSFCIEAQVHLGYISKISPKIHLQLHLDWKLITSPTRPRPFCKPLFFWWTNLEYLSNLHRLTFVSNFVWCSVRWVTEKVSSTLALQGVHCAQGTINLYAKGKGCPPFKKVQFFWTLFKRPLPPPPPFIWTFVLFCRGCFPT